MATNTELPDVSSTNTEITREEAIGLVAGVLDGDIMKFDYRGISVYSSNGVNIQLVDPDSGDVLGNMMAKGRPVLTTLDWIDAKADLYGEGVAA